MSNEFELLWEREIDKIKQIAKELSNKSPTINPFADLYPEFKLSDVKTLTYCHRHESLTLKDYLVLPFQKVIFHIDPGMTDDQLRRIAGIDDLSELKELVKRGLVEIRVRGPYTYKPFESSPRAIQELVLDLADNYGGTIPHSGRHWLIYDKAPECRTPLHDRYVKVLSSYSDLLDNVRACAEQGFDRLPRNLREPLGPKGSFSEVLRITVRDTLLILDDPARAEYSELVQCLLDKLKQGDERAVKILRSFAMVMTYPWISSLGYQHCVPLEYIEYLLPRSFNRLVKGGTQIISCSISNTYRKVSRFGI